MKAQILEVLASLTAYCKTHPVIVCMAASLLAVFVIGYWAGAS